MPFHPEVVDNIYHKSGGCCVYCEKRLSRINYGRRGARGAWHVDHRRSRANGGHPTHLNNLAAACIGCNEDKGSRNAKSYQRSIQLEGPEGGGMATGGVLLAGFILWAFLRGRSPPGSPPSSPPW